MGYNVDDIAPPGSSDAWKPEVGDSIVGTIKYVGDLTGPNYDRTATERKLRIDLVTDEGAEVSIWPVIDTDINGDGYPKADAKAIAAAVRAAEAKSLDVGGRLALKRVDDEPTDRGPAKRWHAEYAKPTAAAAPAPASEDRAETAASLLGG